VNAAKTPVERNSMNGQPKIFSLEEANKLIPEISEHVASLAQKKANYLKRHDELFMFELLNQAEHQAGVAADVEGLEKEIQSLENSLEDIEKNLKEIRSRGCLLRDMDSGQVDFLGKRGNEFVYFCWKRGESEILFYHGLKSGMEDRKPI